MTVLLIDTHCHLDFDWFDGDRESIVDRASEAGIGKIVVPSIDMANVGSVLNLAERFDAVYAAVGVHPNSSAGWQEGWLASLKQAAAHPKVIAIGEIGLDYYRDSSPKLQQHAALEGQLRLAAGLNLPVILHNRDSNADIIEMIAESPISGRPNPGVLHSFLADWDTAKKALDLGLYLGFTGPLTYKKADDLRNIARKVPMNRILVETDAPFLPPQSWRGKRNEPAYVLEVVRCLANIRGLTLEEAAQITTANAVALFGNNLDDRS